MDNHSPKGKLKLLFIFFFLSFIIVPALCSSGSKILSQQQVADSSKDKRKNIPQIQTRDTAKQQVSDSGKTIVKGAGGVSTDTAKFQGTDTAKLKTNTSQTASSNQIPDSVVYKQTTFTREEIIRGERLFAGLAYLGNASVDCRKCHNTHESDTLNWNPDASEISNKYLHRSAADMGKVLLKPLGAKMKMVHKGFQLTAKDVVQMKAYMDHFASTGLQKNKPVITNLLLLIIASVLFLFAATDLIIKRFFTNHKINWAIITVTGIFITYILVINAIEIGRSDGFSPAQPIKFSHAVHAGQNQTDCNYCHYTAKISKSAGIPPGNVCLNCHFLVRNGTRSGQTEIAKIIAHLDEKTPVEWVRIYRLPAFVFFSHEQHVSAGKISCEACHGDVKKIDRLFQKPDLSMGWCIKCHETRKVDFSNKYYKTYYPDFENSLKAGKADSIRVANIGGKDCGKCHY